MIQKIKEHIFSSAQLFIERIGEFAPFGVKVSGEILKPVMALTDYADEINGLEHVNILKDSCEEEFKKQKIDAAAIAYDVLVTIDGIKTDAMCLIINIDGESWEEEYFPYRIENDKCIWLT
ncbi:hypothetical protein Q763_17460 [Flavobacterium beibuense F44-8]|uniref:Uncharacterized protein n=1 Tax=Flavobacterium beibuense F44-8 TaxID=1406840 RepID=A0A0A2LHI9_9FLAO|nr:hypothetical protein [Flavobacterium beibuense]KGO78633.1 hypothetical protein Q763_17460 [Flavobacterium beibuense F44-8]